MDWGNGSLTDKAKAARASIAKEGIHSVQAGVQPLPGNQSYITHHSYLGKQAPSL